MSNDYVYQNSTLKVCAPVERNQSTFIEQKGVPNIIRKNKIANKRCAVHCAPPRNVSVAISDDKLSSKMHFNIEKNKASNGNTFKGSPLSSARNSLCDVSVIRRASKSTTVDLKDLNETQNPNIQIIKVVPVSKKSFFSEATAVKKRNNEISCLSDITKKETVVEDVALPTSVSTTVKSLTATDNIETLISSPKKSPVEIDYHKNVCKYKNHGDTERDILTPEFEDKKQSSCISNNRPRRVYSDDNKNYTQECEGSSNEYECDDDWENYSSGDEQWCAIYSNASSKLSRKEIWNVRQPQSAPVKSPVTTNRLKNCVYNTVQAVSAGAQRANSKGHSIGSPSDTVVSKISLNGQEKNESPLILDRICKIGHGSFGDVFKAVIRGTNTYLAIKDVVVAQNLRCRDTTRQLTALEREIKVMQKLNHSNIVKYLGSKRNCDGLSIYMEYADGGTVGKELREKGPMPEPLAAAYIREMLKGIEYLHSRKIVHRDLKGDNLFLMKATITDSINWSKEIDPHSPYYGQPLRQLKVGDFGTSKELQTIKYSDSVAGTPNFMAPEVIECVGHSIEADIWSVGCCAIQLVNGKAPFSDLDNQMAVMFGVLKCQIIQQLPVSASENLKDFIKVCTYKDPKERWSATLLQKHAWLVKEGFTSTSAIPYEFKSA